MAPRQVTLDTIAFLDSPQARALEGLQREELRRVAEAFLEACYEGVGKAPKLLDGEDVHAVLGHLLPARFARGEVLAERVPEVLAALVEHLEATQVVTQAFEVRRALEATEGEFLEAVRSGRAAHHAPSKVDPFVHGAPKLGRNDPCSCGSGKKYKKCHGKDA
jgi:uncharacterized protein YecA (UPF0149 family)